MQQFIIPQFIDVEDKIFGPISVRQFAEMVIGGIILFIEFKVLPFVLFIIIGFVTLMIVILLAFMKVNGQPFHYFLINIIETLRRPNLKVWNKLDYEVQLVPTPKKEKEKAKVRKEEIKKTPIPRSRLKEIALIVETGGVYKEENK